VVFDDIPCPGHIRTILDAMDLVEGVSSMKVIFEDSRGTLDYDPAIVTAEEIVKRMPWDCPARVLSDEPKG